MSLSSRHVGSSTSHNLIGLHGLLTGIALPFTEQESECAAHLGYGLLAGVEGQFRLRH
jgi:hypothetical protein